MPSQPAPWLPWSPWNSVWSGRVNSASSQFVWAFHSNLLPVKSTPLVLIHSSLRNKFRLSPCKLSGIANPPPYKILRSIPASAPKILLKHASSGLSSTSSIWQQNREKLMTYISTTEPLAEEKRIAKSSIALCPCELAWSLATHSMLSIFQQWRIHIAGRGYWTNATARAFSPFCPRVWETASLRIFLGVAPWAMKFFLVRH